MSLYIIVWGLLCLFAAKGAVTRERRTTARAEFWLCFLLLAGMLALRYGQGTDFFAYQFYYYEMSDTVFDFPLPDVHGEIGYQFLTNAFRLLHLPYEAFIFFLSVLQMGFLLAFFKHYHIDCVLALLLAMPTLYMTYFVSGLRQGVVLAAFLGVLFPLLEKKRYLAYLAGTLLCMLIHTAHAGRLAAGRRHRAAGHTGVLAFTEYLGTVVLFAGHRHQLGGRCRAAAVFGACDLAV